MTPSETISVAQISTIKVLIGAALQKSELPKEPTKQVIETQGAELTEAFVAELRRRVEAISNMIVRRVIGINRTQTPQEALDATGRRQYTTQLVVDAMSRGTGDNVELMFFELDYDPWPVELECEYELRGLKADPFALAKYMEDNPAFADDRPVACQWDLDEKGETSFAYFHRWANVREVRVDRDACRWVRIYRFAGVRK